MASRRLALRTDFPTERSSQISWFSSAWRKMVDSLLLLMKRICLLPLFAFLAAAQSGAGAGQVLFSQFCAVCHGAAGEGASGPDLTNPLWQRSVRDDELDRIIRSGRTGTAMPAFQDRIDA